MNTNIYNSLTNFIKKRTFELLGLLLISISLMMLVAFITYSPNDPSFVYNEQNTIILNFFGIYGSIISDFLLQSFGILSFLILITLISWGVHLIKHKRIDSFVFKLLFLVLYLIFGCIYIYISFNHSWWLDPHGNSGFVGEFTAEYKISKDGRYRVRGFNRSVTNNLLQLNSPYTQGVGLFYRKEFDTAGEL